MASDALLVKGSELNNTFLSLLIEKHLPLDKSVNNIHLSSDQNQAVVHLNQQITDDEFIDFKRSLENDGKHETPSSILFAPNTISVQKLADDVDKEYLELYFESKSHSGGGDVDNVEMFETHYAAVVTFANFSDMESVLKRKTHHLCDQEIKVERCLPFWKPEQNMKRSSAEIDKERDTNVTMKKIAKSTVATNQPSQSYTNLDESHFETCQEDICPKNAPEKDSESEMIIDYSDIQCEMIDEHPQKTANDINEPPGLDLRHTNEEVIKDKPQASVAPMQSLSALQITDHSIEAQDKFPATKIKYLHDKIIQLESNFQIKVDIDYKQESALIKSCGNESNIMRFKLTIYEEMQKIQETIPELTKEICSILKTNEGFHFAEKQIDPAKLIQNGNVFTVVAKSDQSQRAAKIVENMFKIEVISLQSHHKNFATSPKWKQYIDNIAKNDLVTVIAGANNVKLVGIGDLVNKLKEELLKELKKNSHKQQDLEIKRGIYRLIQQHLSRKMFQMQSQFRTNIDVNKKHDKWFISCSGCADDVDLAFNDVRALVDSVKYTTVTCGKPGMAKFFLSNHGQRLVKGIEAENEAIIETRAGASEPSIITQSIVRPKTLSNPQKEDKTTQKIEILKGDITKMKADALVNSVANDNRMLDKCGAIAKSFLRAGGDVIGDEFTSFGGLKCGDVKSTLHSGNLKCQLIIHASIRSWDGSRTRKMLCEVLRKCLKQLDIYGLNSIVFPTLGCGNLRYPNSEVIKCFKEIVSEFHNKKITIVAFDNGVYQEFKTAFSHADVPYQVQRTKFYVPKKLNAQAVTFHINAMRVETLEAVKSEINKIIKEFYVESEIKNQCLETIEDNDLQTLLQSKSEQAFVSVDISNCKVLLYGEQFQVSKEKERIQQLLASIEYKQRNPDYIKKHRGKKGFLQAIIDEGDKLPEYWTKKGFLRDISMKFKVTKKNVLVKVGAKDHNAIKDLITKTWVQKFVGHGADAVGLSHSNIQVTTVERIENPSIYKNYLAGRSLICEEAVHNDIAPISSLKEPEILTASYNIPELDGRRIKEINEYFLFHGTKSDYVEHIVVQGGDTRMGSLGLFGKGLYLAESSTKADQYADNRKSRRTSGDFYMVIFRVLLGNIYHQKGSARFTRPPCRQGGCHKDNCPHFERFHSVMGTEKDGGIPLNFREFVVFDNKYAYPEYLVTYNRI